MYNATVWRMDGERVVSVFTAQVSGGVMLRSNAVQCTGLEGSPAYDAYVRRNAFAGHGLRIVADDCAGYRGFFAGLRTPPAEECPVCGQAMAWQAGVWACGH